MKKLFFLVFGTFAAFAQEKANKNEKLIPIHPQNQIQEKNDAVKKLLQLDIGGFAAIPIGYNHHTNPIAIIAVGGSIFAKSQI